MLARISAASRVSATTISLRFNSGGAVLRGKVKWFDAKKGYGFLTPDGPNPKDVFVHFSAIQPRGEDSFKSLNDGDAVQFKIEDTARGPHAVDVNVTDE
eukprot:c18912_g1_i1.p1 GENE.c18912_g1_i1~~c18912_g1_i1.p1  ORF type:complete len:114 (-),score=25.85 c18912_g1_i1:162-458(-)